MDILLDTTIQIDRITGSKDRKSAIEKVLRGNNLFCSTYVLGEYYESLIKDFITLYGLFLIEKNISETGKKISEQIFGRSQSRVSKIFFNIIGLCDMDIDEIEDMFSLYTDLLQDLFHQGIQELLDITKCARADRIIKYEDGIPIFPQVHCTKKKEICGICPFWKNCQKAIEQILEKDGVDDKIKKILSNAKNNEKEYRGKNCLTLGDTIISLEALIAEQNMAVCTSNKNDFTPICDAIGVEIVSPDYSWKNSDKNNNHPQSGLTN